MSALFANFDAMNAVIVVIVIIVICAAIVGVVWSKAMRDMTLLEGSLWGIVPLDSEPEYRTADGKAIARDVRKLRAGVPGPAHQCTHNCLQAKACTCGRYPQRLPAVKTAMHRATSTEAGTALDRARAAGIDAAINDYPAGNLAVNPYPLGSLERQVWQRHYERMQADQLHIATQLARRTAHAPTPGL